MKNRIRSIFLLMTVCILGINVFQGYWLYTTYQMQLRQFSRAVREALYQTVQKQQLSEAQVLFDHRGPGERPKRIVMRGFERSEDGEEPLETILDHPVRDRIFVRRTDDSMTTQVRYPDGKTERFVISRKMSHQFRRDTVVSDTLARRISRMLLLNWAGDGKLNLARLDSLYRLELQARDIAVDYALDTLRFKPRAGRVVIAHFHDEPKEGYAVLTPPVPVNPVQGQFVQASFKRPTYYLMRKMGWLSAGSVLLLILTTGCFLYMLSTILKQKKLSEIKNDFINNMTHELKTPIATVSAAVEAMQHFGALNDPKRTEAYLNISRAELQRLSDLVEKVLNMAVEERQEMTLNPEWVRPSELISQLVDNHRLKAEKAVQFEVDRPADDEPVWVDRFHLVNALNNLIDNAIKYSKEAVTIRIASRSEENIWRLSVQDNGIGIPKAYQEAIFDRFFRVPTGNLHPVKGFGLGLSYVRQVVERHGGQIEVSSEPGVGSEFVLLIPEKGDSGMVGVRKFRLYK
ncbi:sensor histidine kinase [Tellurirhabdus rosea]|uniref:sensor histidine kinase n=1 Tax=Tellurirhabdus rosea TaxID=2674997 RepID=UPI0022534232|nr:HAMP domain-containing sensor histidine kinase [Tellurirhabdus rosea]